MTTTRGPDARPVVYPEDHEHPSGAHRRGPGRRRAERQPQAPPPASWAAGRKRIGAEYPSRRDADPRPGDPAGEHPRAAGAARPPGGARRGAGGVVVRAATRPTPAATSPTSRPRAERAWWPSRSRWPPRRSSSTRRSRPPGVEVVETDLGEWIIQLAGETPSHIIAPAVHHDRYQIARRALGTRRHDGCADRARGSSPPSPASSCASGSSRADIGITGVNFARGRDRLDRARRRTRATARMCTSLPRVHVAVMGMERVVGPGTSSTCCSPARPLGHRPARSPTTRTSSPAPAGRARPTAPTSCTS